MKRTSPEVLFYYAVKLLKNFWFGFYFAILIENEVS